MKHSIFGILTLQEDNIWHVSLFDGKIKNSYRDQNEAVDFVESELIKFSDDYGFDVCYRIENKILSRRSYVLLKRNKSGKVEKTSMSRFEYATTHFFFYSKDKRRRIIDYKNPDFNQLTRHCVSSQRWKVNVFFSLLILAIAELAVLLGLFITTINNQEVKIVEATEPGFNNEYVFISLLGVALLSSIALFAIYFIRNRKYNKLVRTNSTWHETYLNVNWRKYYRYLHLTNNIALGFAITFILSFISFGVLFSLSSLFKASQLVEEVNAITIVYVLTTFGVFNAGYISTYFLIKFSSNLKGIAPVILTKNGMKTYKAWLKGKDISDAEMEKAFHPVEEHMLYPNSKVIITNPKFANISDEQIKIFRKDVRDYKKLALQDKFGKYHVDPAHLAEAKMRYSAW